MATASGMLSIFSSGSQQNHAPTVGFGIGTEFCSLAAGSVGSYEQFFKQSPDPERGRDPIELNSPSAIGFINDTVKVPAEEEVSTSTATTPLSLDREHEGMVSSNEIVDASMKRRKKSGER
ncbi:hypothetical protein V5O48_014213, partial [Marasmius crinis-equi]